MEKLLTLTIEKKWFDMILSGEKMEEGITLIQMKKDGETSMKSCRIRENTCLYRLKMRE